MKKIYALALTAAFAISFSACSGSGENAGADSGKEHAGHSHGHDEHGETDEIELTQTQMETVGITLGHIGKKALADAVQATGVIAVNPQDEAFAAPLMPGMVTRICVVEGDCVKAGQTIAYVENTEIVTLQQDLISAEQENTLAQKEYERQKALSEQGAGVRKNYEQAETAMKIASTRVSGLRVQLKQLGIDPEAVFAGKIATTFAVKADIPGVISRIMVKTGGFSDVQNPIAVIINNAAVYCSLNIFEKDLPLIKTGETVEIRLTNTPGNTLEGVVSEINRSIDQATRSLTVKVRIVSETAQQLIPGMAVNALISTGEEETDVLPDDAVVSAGGKSYIFVLEDSHDEDNETAYHFRRTEVSAGARSMGYTRIRLLAPIADNATVVTSNAFYLNSMASDHGEHSH